MQSAQVNPGATCSNSIVSLTNSLKAQAGQTGLSERIRLIRNHPILWTDALRYVQRDLARYHREIVETNDHFQLLILTWLPGQKSDIHNHCGSQCVVRVLSGAAIETVYCPRADRSFSRNASICVRGSTTGGEDSDIHTLENHSKAKQDLVTMHVYFPPLKKMDVFTVRDGRLFRMA